MAKGVYTIDIPGMTDIFRVPIPEETDKQLRKARIERMKTARHGLPESLDWIPPLINFLDDAQDMLYVALVLAKPLLRKLPARFIPWLGWVLTINDALNILTALAGMVAGGTGVKRIHADILDLFSTTRPRMLKKVEDFLRHTNWLGFALQAGQVMTNLTGYGISLGAIMGCVSDAVWGLIRKIQGADIEVRLPPPEDPVGKAARFIIQSPVIKTHPHLFSDEDLKLAIAARGAAMQILWAEADVQKLRERAQQMANMKVPVFGPTWQASIEALREAGIPEDMPYRNVYALDERTTTFVQLTQLLSQKEHEFQEYMKHGTKFSEAVKTMLQLLESDGSRTFWDFTTDRQPNIVEFPYPWEVAYLRAIEWEIFPPPVADKWGIAEWLLSVWTQKVINRQPISWGLLLWLYAKERFGRYFLELKIPRPPAHPQPRPKRKHKHPYKWNVECLREELGKARHGMTYDFSKCVYS